MSALPTVELDPPTISMTFGVNDSPLAGRDGSHVIGVCFVLLLLSFASFICLCKKHWVGYASQIPVQNYPFVVFEGSFSSFCINSFLCFYLLVIL